MNKVERHMDICKNLNKIYEQKNHDYGDSFHDTFVEEGAAMARIRLSDKLNRFKKLSREDSEQKVNDESIRDTLLDLANYAIMTVMEMDILEEDDARTKIKTAIREHGKMKDEYETALKLNHEEVKAWNFNGKPLEVHLDCRTDPDPCEKCTYPGKADCISTGGCMDRAEWERRQMDAMIEWEKQQMSAVDIRKEEKLKDPEEDENPCIMCGKSTIDKAACCGCPERLEWEKRQKNFANSGEFICPKCYNMTKYNPQIDKYVCGVCGTMYSITAK